MAAAIAEHSTPGSLHSSCTKGKQDSVVAGALAHCDDVIKPSHG